MAENRRIKIEDLAPDLQNPRYPAHASQRDAITKIAHDQGPKIVRLAEDIVERGPNPSKRVIVAESPTGDGTYDVLEGNRRLAVLKLLASKELRTTIGLRPMIVKRLTEIADKAIADKKLPTEFDCVVMTREQARYWIQLEHTGENEGVGVVGWDGAQAARFREKATPAIQAVDLVTPHLPPATQALLAKIPVTNVERVLNTPEARRIIGVEVADGRLQLLAPEEQSMARLAAVVSDIALGKKKVTDLDTKSQRVAYAQQVAARPLAMTKGSGGTGSAGGKAAGGAASAGAGNAAAGPRRIGLERKTLIPRRFKLTIPNTRLNAIYAELQKIDVEKFKNSASVLLRVFVELSVDEYMIRNTLPMTVPPAKPGQAPKDKNLQSKITAVVDHLANKGVSKSELQGIRLAVGGGVKHHPLSITTMHAYVHNQHYSPTADNLKVTWDNIQAFMAAVWK